MRVIRISIRTQLICLVSFFTILALLVLALTTGLKNTRYILSLQGEQLQIISMLKAAQLTQAIQMLYYQVYWVSLHESIQASLIRYQAGNYSTTNWDDAIMGIQGVLNSTDVLLEAQIYDTGYNLVCDVTKNSTFPIPPNLSSDNQFLFPLSPDLKNQTSSVILEKLNTTQGYIAGPALNQTQNSTINDYLISFTLPVFGNTSASVEEPPLAGYLTVAAKAYSLFNVLMNDVLDNNHFMLLANIQNYNLNQSDLQWVSSYELLGSVSHISDKVTYYSTYGDMYNANYFLHDPNAKNFTQPRNLTDPRPDFIFLFPDNHTTLDTSASIVYPFESFPSYQRAIGLQNNSGGGFMLDTHTPFNKRVSAGYSNLDLVYVDWVIIVEEAYNETYTPISHLTKILVATILPLAVFIITATYILGHFIVRPINLLVDAAAQTTLYGKGPKYGPDNKPKSKYSFSYLENIMSFLKLPGLTRSPSPDSGDNIRNINLNRYNNNSANNSTNIDRAENETETKDDTTVTDIFEEANDDSGSTEYFRIPGHIERRRTFITDELTTLTDTFNLMTDELQKQYSHLEECVRERTRDLKLAKTAADNANEAKTLFIANITHELRTPLNGILGMTAVSLTEDNPNKLRRSLKVIFKSGELLLHLLTDLLTFSKNQVGRMTLDEKEFTMITIYSQLRAIFSKQARDKNVDLTLSVQPYQKIVGMMLFGDSNRILQIIINMASNALKFTPVGGKVDIGIKLRGEFDPIATASNGNEKLCVKRRRKKRCPSRTSNPSSAVDSKSISIGPHTKSNSFSGNTANGVFMDSTVTSTVNGITDSPCITRTNGNPSPVGYSPSMESSSSYPYNYGNYSQSIADIDEDGSLPYDYDDSNSFGYYSDFDVFDDGYDTNTITTVNHNDNETILSSEQNNLTYSSRDPHTGIVESYYVGNNARNNKMVWHLGREVASDDILNNEGGTPSLSFLRSKEEMHPGSHGCDQKMGGVDIAPSLPSLTAKKTNHRPSILRTASAPSPFRGGCSSQSIFHSSEVRDATPAFSLGSGVMKPRTMVFEITVTDDGPGIAPHLQERVFEPFVQGEQALSRKYGGTGLGLSICRQLATMMGGFMNLESDVGEGSTFTLQIPLKWTGVVPSQDDSVILNDNQKMMGTKSSEPTSATANVNNNNNNNNNNNSLWPNTYTDASDAFTTTNEDSFQITRPQFSDNEDDEDDDNENNIPGFHTTKSRSGSRSGPVDFKILKTSMNEKTTIQNESEFKKAFDDDSSLPSLPMPLSRKPKILVAEDNHINQLVIKRMLHLEGITDIKFVENGEMAFKEIETVMNLAKNPNLNGLIYDLVFMDIQMPIMGGIEATEIIRNKLGYKKPIISLTAFGDDNTYIERCINSGMNDYLAKPIKREALSKLLTKWFNSESDDK